MSRWLIMALAAAVFGWTGSQARADNDLIRLGGADVGAKTQTLGFDGGVSTELVRGRGYGSGYNGRGHGGGYYGRSYYGGGYGRGYYGGYYRPYYGSYYRPYYGYGYGYYRPYVGAYIGYSPYYSNYYSYPSYYGGYYGGSGPCATTTTTMPQAVVLGQSSYSSPPTVVNPIPVPQKVVPQNGNGDGTFPYNGGPPTITPLPSDNAPAVEPQPPSVPREGKLVSIPAKTTPTTYFYRSYGNQPQEPATTPRATSAPVRVVSQPAAPKTTVRVTYPAYGQ